MKVYVLQVVSCLALYCSWALSVYADSTRQNVSRGIYPYQELVLTREQKNTIDLMYNNMVHNRYSEITTAKRSLLNRQLIALTESQNLNETELAPLIDQIAKIKAIDLMHQVRIQHKIWQILTEDQKNHIRQMRERMSLKQ